MSHPVRWFRLAAWLHFHRDRRVTASFAGVRVVVLGFRREWFGPALRLRMPDGEVRHGIDPAALSCFEIE